LLQLFQGYVVVPVIFFYFIYLYLLINFYHELGG